jgi:hypothetical protein
MIKFVFTILPILAVLNGCTHSIHSVHVSGYDPYVAIKKANVISARTEQFVILGFANDTHYVEQARKKLEGECPDGQIQGITTQHSTSHGFFSWTNKILMQGLCIKS